VNAQYLAQAFIMMRTMGTVHRALRQEFGRAEMLAVVVPGSAIAVSLVLLAAHQVMLWPRPAEMQTGGPVNFWLMVVYLAGSSLFSFVFMVMLTQRLVAHLRHASVRDPLTGLYNRRAIAEALERHWLRHRRGQQPLAVLLIDIDHFKRINDTLGHAAGDSVLMHLSSLLQRR
jgi:predicted signal transduction protein with EAL and GGDEF domain